MIFSTGNLQLCVIFMLFRSHDPTDAVCGIMVFYRIYNQKAIRQATFTCVGRQLTLCDPIWLVMLYSCLMSFLSTAICVCIL